jgi:hypothetical protein
MKQYLHPTGKPTEATLDLRFANKKWSGRFRPLEIKTLRMNIETGRVQEVSVLEE